MIDIEWLKRVQFDARGGGRVTGLAGIGAQFIVFKLQASGEHPELGKDQVLKIWNTPRLGFHIREIPPNLELRPTYDAARVNRKLRAQVGNPLFDSMVEPYNDLYEYIIAVLHKGGLDAIRLMIDDEESEAFFAFLLNTPGVRRRLEDAAFLDATGDPRQVVTWNGIVHAIEEPRGTVSSWARSMLEELNSVPSPEGAAPGRLSENPFWIWGGGVLDGFFTNAEMADAVSFITTNFGDLVAGEEGPRLRFQMIAFLSLLWLVVERDTLQRLTQFCNLAGFQFALPDPEPQEETQSETPSEERRTGIMPNLSPPSVAPQFPEEGLVDPMAQDPRLLAAAAAIFSDFADRISVIAHASGIAVMLPQAETDSAAHWKPWRSVTPVGDSTNGAATVDGRPFELYVTQRLLVTAQAVAAHSGSGMHDGMSRLIEEIGYIAIGRSHDVRDSPRLNANRSLGMIAAHLHRIGYIHGDLQPDNFTFKESGEVQSMFDLGRTYNPGRPLTLLERASDLAVLKAHVTFLEWEAAKFGYRSEASDADEVLAEFEHG